MDDFESVNDALIACVKACGGSKQVGHKLWPEKTMESAQRHLLACLNEDKPERLSPDQLVLLMRMGHERGFHGVMGYLAESVGYAEPVPTAPHDELADLLKQYLQQRESDKKTDERLERLIHTHLGLRAA